MNNKQTVIVTGGAGYIGSHTVIELIENTNYDIIIIDNFSNSSPKTVERIKKITGKQIKNYNIDICDKNALENIFAQTNNIVGIIHFAAFKSVPESVNIPYKYYNNNINSLLTILECCVKFKIEHFIFSSSCSVYGNIKELPVKESTPLGKAESPYAHTKQIGEAILKDYAKINPSLMIIALRYFNPVGAHASALIGEDPINPPSSLVPVITQTAIGKIKEMKVHGADYTTRDGSCIRDYIHVSDIARAHIKALEYSINKKQKTNYTVFNLGTGNGVSVLEAIKAFEKIANQKLNYSIGPKREGDVEAIFSDTSLSEKELDWKPQYTLDKMVETAWKWELHLKTEQ